jgi:uncharacterized lipoprotein YmbA
MMHRFYLTLVTLLVCALLFSACTGKSPKADFYSLGAIHTSGPADALSREITVAVGPVSIPAELDRKQIVTRDAGNRVKLAELHRWAGPLQDNITFVLAANLAALLKTERVAPYNRENLFPFTHHVVFSVNRFDGWPTGEVLLDVTWSIKKSGVSDPLIVQRSEIREPVATPNYAGLVAAQSKALAEISSRIADAIKQLVQ